MDSKHESSRQTYKPKSQAEKWRTGYETNLSARFSQFKSGTTPPHRSIQLGSAVESIKLDFDYAIIDSFMLCSRGMASIIITCNDTFLSYWVFQENINGALSYDLPLTAKVTSVFPVGLIMGLIFFSFYFISD